MKQLLKNHSFKQIMLSLSFFTLLALAFSYTLSMHYLFSTSISRHMREIWQRQAINIAEQAKFSIITESKSDIKKILLLLDNPLIIHASVYTLKQRLYSTNSASPCGKINILANTLTETKNYWCISSAAKDNQNQQIIGGILLVVSKEAINDLILQNLINNAGVVSLLTAIIFGFLYYSTQHLTAPLIKLSKVMKKISSHDRGLRIESEGTMDMRNIQESFNLMILKIEKNENDLEEKIKDRVLELSDAYRKAQGASQVKSDILKIVSHEMKTPLHSALFYLHLMKSDEGYFVKDIINCLERLQKQIDNLLNYSQASENKVALNKTDFSPKSLLEQITEEYSPLLKIRKNQLIIKCDFQGQIHSDEQLIKQIVNNLIDNANKYCETGKVTVVCKNYSNHLIISVTDTGCGISEENLENIFIPFWQIDMSSARVHEGSGLGLSICQLFAETLNSNISVTSTINKGSVFTLSIPIK